MSVPLVPAGEPAPPPVPRSSLRLGLLVVLVLALLLLAAVNYLARQGRLPDFLPAPATPPAPTATEAVALSPGATPSGVIAALPTAVPTAPPPAAGNGTPALARTGTITTSAAGVTLIDFTGSAFACGRVQNCTQPAAPGRAVFAGGEARTGADGRLRLQSPAGLLILAPDSTLRLQTLDSGQVAVLLVQGQVLVRAAPGRAAGLAVSAGPVTATGAGSNFAVQSLGDGSVHVAVPADSARPVRVHSPAGDLDLAPGMQIAWTPNATPVPPAALDPATARVLSALAGSAPGGTPEAPNTTVVAVASPPPPPAGIVTATIVLTPPPEHTLPPITVIPLSTPPGLTPTAPLTAAVALPPTSPPHATTAPARGTPSPGSTAPPGTAVPAATAPAVARGPAALAQAALRAMPAAGSYTFGATRGVDPATAEFSAGTVAGDTACWTATAKGQATDYQVRNGTVYLRSGGNPWQPQPDQHGLPAWLAAWQWLGQIDAATLADLGTQSLDAVLVHRLRARLAPAAGQGPNAWIDALVGDPDHLVHSLILYQGDPRSGAAVLKIGFSSLGAPLSCPALNPP